MLGSSFFNLNIMQKAGFLRFLVLYLGFSFVVSSVAVPTTRSVKSTEEALSSSVNEFQPQDAKDLNDRVEQFIDVEKGYIRGRMDTDTTNDYPGTGANNHHDPKSPGAK